MIYDNLIINEKIWSQLNAMVENRKLPHAMLFHGPHGTGKEAHAIKLAALLNDDTENSQLVKIKNFQHPNINLILPMPREKTINKKSNALDCLSEKSLEHLIEMKKQKILKYISTTVYVTVIDFSRHNQSYVKVAHHHFLLHQQDMKQVKLY